MSILAVALDILHEASSRKWVLALFVVITLIAAVLALFLRMDVVDGMLAGTQLFGNLLQHDLRAVDQALRPVLLAGAYGVFYCGLVVGILACSDFAPELLSPGRIEHLLALPVRRVELLLGIYLGVVAIAAIAAVYATGLFTVLMGVKSGVWSPVLLLAGLASCGAFCLVYAVMLASAVWVRSPSLSAAVGGLFLLATSVFTLPGAAAVFDAGVERDVWLAATAWLPRTWLLATAAPGLAGLESPEAALPRAIAGACVFGMAMLALATWQLERRDF